VSSGKRFVLVIYSYVRLQSEMSEESGADSQPMTMIVNGVRRICISIVIPQHIWIAITRHTYTGHKRHSALLLAVDHQIFFLFLVLKITGGLGIAPSNGTGCYFKLSTSCPCRLLVTLRVSFVIRIYSGTADLCQPVHYPVIKH